MTGQLQLAPDQVGRLIATAFAELAQTAWLAGAHARVRALTPMFAAVAAHAYRHGRVDIAERRDRAAGVAVWLPHDAPPVTDYPGAEPDVVARWQQFEATLATGHLVEPHRHLAFLAVARHSRRRGVGSGLLDTGHNATDLPIHLDAEHAGLVAYYCTRGYLPGTGIRMPNGTLMWPMRRPPRSEMSR